MQDAESTQGQAAQDPQAEPVSEAKEAIQSALVGEVPLTDVPSESLLDSETPLESQPDVQGTLVSEQQHAAVYSPGVNEAPEQTPEQIAAASGEAIAAQGSAGADKGLSKQARREKQQAGRVSPGRSGRASPGPVGSTRGFSSPEGRPKFDGNFTFSAAPHVPMAKKLQPKNYSHSDARLREIKRENKMMVNRLAHVSTSQSPRPIPSVPAASAGVNRRRAADHINEENFAIFRRLQAVQPSKEIRKERLEHDFRINQQYAQNASHFRSATPTFSHVESLSQ